MAGWVPLADLLKSELIQCTEEGREIAGLDEQVQQAIASSDLAQINAVYDRWASAPMREDFP